MMFDGVSIVGWSLVLVDSFNIDVGFIMSV